MNQSTLFESPEATLSQVEGFSPIRVCDIEISEPLPALSQLAESGEKSYQRAQCLIRLHTHPLGVLDLSLEHPTATDQEFAELIWQELGDEINEHLRADGLESVNSLDASGLPFAQNPTCLAERDAFLQHAPFVSIVLSTRDRPDRLARCLPALLGQRYPEFEIVLVDNAPATSATADFVEQVYANESRIRYVREDRPGLSAGRNRGVAEARGEIVAFTDDDVVVDPYWLAGLAQGFTVAEKVGCVTNLLLPLELETQTQLWFEEFGGFNKGFVRRVFDRKNGGKRSPLYPFTAGGFGTGAGMAFTKEFLQKEKGFDVALGAGSPTGAGEDLVAFLYVILDGYRLVYEPASLAYHEHRRDYPALKRQTYCYGTGLTAYLTKIIVDRPWLLFSILVRIPQGLFFIFSAQSSKNQKKSTHFPKELSRIERKGMLLGPLLYFRGRFK